jgi:hypothetical protein
MHTREKLKKRIKEWLIIKYRVTLKISLGEKTLNALLCWWMVVGRRGGGGGEFHRLERVRRQLHKKQVKVL